MKLFVEAMLPEVCYLGEAAHWIALGRVPSEEASIPINEPFRMEDFRAFDLDVDMERYESLYESDTTLDRPSEEDLRARYRRIYARHGDDEELLRDLKETELMELENLRWAADLDRRFDHHVDRARSKLFSALSEGYLQGYGRVQKLQPNSEANGEVNASEDVEVPREAWTLRGIDWDNSSLESGNRLYSGCQLFTDELLMAFPRPMLDAVPAAGEVFGATFVLGSDVPEASKRGRKSTSVPVRAVLEWEFFRRLKAGELPAKQESILEEAMELAGEWGITISRTTAQRMLKPVFEAQALRQSGS